MATAWQPLDVISGRIERFCLRRISHFQHSSVAFAFRPMVMVFNIAEIARDVNSVMVKRAHTVGRGTTATFGPPSAPHSLFVWIDREILLRNVSGILPRPTGEGETISLRGDQPRNIIKSR